ncbi:helix-turn-helix transcriptional regulator [Erwinia persicina]|uniref:helix-turn-helix transcriptional regulator n=1 Tax=Erwinia persicina TaxID=55211 RepID=UPI0039AF010B
MSDPRSLTLMMFDHDRYFADGVLRFLQSHYSQVIIRLSVRQVTKIDLLMTAMDAVSLCASQQYARRLTTKSQLLVVHDSGERGFRTLPESLQGYPVTHLHRRLPLARLASLLHQLIPEKDSLITVIDPRSLKEDRLTPQEKTFIAHMRVHLTPHQIASSMALHPKTISTYKRSVMLKLGMQKNLELYHWLFYSSPSDRERS